MPREGGTTLAVFRLFCKDPGEVVELRTIRNTTTNHKLESFLNKPQFEEDQAHEMLNSVKSSSSWSCGGRNTNHQKGGALELEHSLVMLRKMQPDSNYQPKKKKKKKTKGRDSKSGGSSRFADLELGKMDLFNPKDGLQVQQFHYNSSSDGLLLNKANHDQDPTPNLFDIDSSPLGDGSRRVMTVDSSDVPSTSSSQTSFVHSSGFVSPESSISSTPLNQSQLMDEMIESVKLKGLLKNKPSSNRNIDDNHNHFSPKHRWCGDDHTRTPPIVLIKPVSMRYSCLNLDLPVTPMPRDKSVRSSRESPVSDKSMKKQTSLSGEVYYDRRTKREEKECNMSRGKQDIKRNVYSNTNSSNRPLKNDHKSSGRNLDDWVADKHEPSSSSTGDQLDREGNIIEDDHVEKEYTSIIPVKNAREDCMVGATNVNLLDNIDDYQEFDCSLSESSSLTSFDENEFLLDPEITKREGIDTLSPPNTSKVEEEAAGNVNDRETSALTTVADPTNLECAVEGFGEIERWKTLLLSSSSFIHYANELFDMQADPERHIHGVVVADNEESQHDQHPDELLFSSSTLVLDCANELLEFYSYLLRERLMWSPPRIPILLPGMKHRSCFASLDQVADQVSKGIDSLRSHRRNCGGYGGYDYPPATTADNLPLIVERDVMGNNGVISGVWDAGWINCMGGGATDAVEEVAKVVGWIILEGLIEETAEDLFV